ncbi:MAG: hypothetical protein KDH88_06035 [Chromatiales bacterium]|nr:hypothetical protein [Chromatiales bacterium]
MAETENDLIKRRDICFSQLHPDPRQHETAVQLLAGVDGVFSAEAAGQLCLRVEYDVRLITLRVIECVLEELGFHLDNSLIVKLKRALHYYTEETQRANLGLECSQDSTTTQVFVCRYAKRRHGCRDERPEHWRKYL